MEYAVAHVDFIENENRITIVEADDPITAMIDGVRKLSNSDGNLDVDLWLDGFLKDIPEPAGYAARIEEIKTEFFDVKQAVSEPMPV